MLYILDPRRGTDVALVFLPLFLSYCILFTTVLQCAHAQHLAKLQGSPTQPSHPRCAAPSTSNQAPPYRFTLHLKAAHVHQLHIPHQRPEGHVRQNVPFQVNARRHLWPCPMKVPLDCHMSTVPARHLTEVSVWGVFTHLHMKKARTGTSISCMPAPSSRRNTARSVTYSTGRPCAEEAANVFWTTRRLNFFARPSCRMRSWPPSTATCRPNPHQLSSPCSAGGLRSDGVSQKHVQHRGKLRGVPLSRLLAT